MSHFYGIQNRNKLNKNLFRNCINHVKIHNTGLRKPVLNSKRNFHRNIANRSCNFGDRDKLSNLSRFIPGKN